MTRLELGDVALDVEVVGPDDGFPLILLHGFPVGRRSWIRTAPALVAAGFRVVMPDQRGYGASDAPADLRAYGKDRLVTDVLTLADRLGIGRFGLIGHDFGGAVAWSVAQEHPDRVARLAVLNCPHPEIFGDALRHDLRQMRRSWYIGWFQIPGLAERVLAARDSALVRRLLVSSAAPGSFPPDEVDRIAAEIAKHGLRGRIDWYRAAARVPAAPSSRFMVDPPTLLVWGERDDALGAGLADASIARASDGTVLRLPDATHWPQLDAPVAVNDALRRWFSPPGSR
jgi:pimeloyl-ACP methyl ester carboxylesterase